MRVWEKYNVVGMVGYSEFPVTGWGSSRDKWNSKVSCATVTWVEKLCTDLIIPAVSEY